MSPDLGAQRSRHQNRDPWPPRDRLVVLAEQHGTCEATAAACGKSATALREYLSRRPELRAEVVAHWPRTGKPRRAGPCTATRHGTYSAYHAAGCCCPEAREDWRLYMKRRREHRHQPRRVAAIGTHRRLRALMALGHAGDDLSAQLGYATRSAALLLLRRDTVRPATAARVAALYDRLSMTVGTSQRTRARAAAAGWAPPLAWNDADMDDPGARPHGMPSRVVPRPGRRKNHRKEVTAA